VGWDNGGMPAVRPQPRELLGQRVRLAPLTHTDLPALFEAIGHPIVFAGGYGGGPAGYTDTGEGFVAFAEKYYNWESGNVYGVWLVGGPHNGVLVGTSTLGDFEETAERAHIGWTAYDPRVWGTAVNAEVKLLMLTEAFEAGFGRVKIQADALNARSRAAIAGIGATFEGILRRDARRADGSWRDAAVFSVLIEEWPAIRQRLIDRVDSSNGRPVLYRSMPTGSRISDSVAPETDNWAVDAPTDE
jgi:RimJ/RimL family protein N-acetyltransferase